MSERLSRTERILGHQAMDKLAHAKVLVFGLGGVGGYVVEALARSGIGTLDLVDHDTVSESNLNRQIIATRETIGMSKTEAFRKRISTIDPDITVNCHDCFYLPEQSDLFDFTQYDYIVDAIDTVTAKIDIICKAKEANVPVISAMGCGNRMDPTKLEVIDIYKTKGDPLAKVMRHELKQRRIKKLKVVCSTELPIRPVTDDPQERRLPGSTAFVPSAAGLMIASVVVREIIEKNP